MRFCRGEFIRTRRAYSVGAIHSHAALWFGDRAPNKFGPASRAHMQSGMRRASVQVRLVAPADRREGDEALAADRRVPARLERDVIDAVLLGQ